MKLDSFRRTRCISALKKLGFVIKKSRRGKHDKYMSPDVYLEQKRDRQPPFIMVPRGKLHCQDEIVKELRNLGGDELVREFESYL